MMKFNGLIRIYNIIDMYCVYLLQVMYKIDGMSACILEAPILSS